MHIRVIRPALLLGLAFAIAQWSHIVALLDVADRSNWGIIWFVLVSAGAGIFLYRSIHVQFTGEEHVEVRWMDRTPDVKGQ